MEMQNLQHRMIMAKLNNIENFVDTANKIYTKQYIIINKKLVINISTLIFFLILLFMFYKYLF